MTTTLDGSIHKLLLLGYFYDKDSCLFFWADLASFMKQLAIVTTQHLYWSDRSSVHLLHAALCLEFRRSTPSLFSYIFTNSKYRRTKIWGC